MSEVNKIEITIDEAKEIIAKCTHPDYSNKEHELFKAAAAKLLEENDPGFEYEYESEDEEVKESRLEKEISTGIKEGGNAARKSVTENITQYAGEVISNIQNLGAAGSVAFSSATYFQSAEMIETSQEVVSIVETVEYDYGQTLNSYIFEQAATFVEKIPYVNETKLAQNVAAAMTEISKNAETPQEREERRAAKSEESNTLTESTEEVESEPTEESNSEEAETQVEAKSEPTEESTEEVESDNQQENNNENELGEESKNEESSIEANSSETKPDVQTDSLQGEANDSGNIEDLDDSTTITPDDGSINEIDPIKPHSMVGDDAFESILTPNDAIEVSPNGPQND